MSDLHEAAQAVWGAADAHARAVERSTRNGVAVDGQPRPIWVRVGVVRLGTILRPLWWETIAAGTDDQADIGRWRWVREGAPPCAACGQPLAGVDANQPATLEWAPGRFDVECQTEGCGAKHWIEEVQP